ncbi:hypothetical protein E3N88_41689 [Mikania micrantha]|uniref:GDSL esterase/lipase n=1 Tax=Mikania micrantha TaxID=192012 RepID=A0A5N6LJX7_9ASTR|nr:hypothetical protein E3N88_41689 [Mikania micrantha]
MANAVQKLFLLAACALANGIMMMTARAATDAPIFVFGDSNADVGTNNYLEACTAKANHLYHGIDFPFSNPTGRFSNGKNIIDQIVRLLGNYKLSPPPFLSLLGHKPTYKRNIFQGANFASGGAGIFWETGQKHFHEVITMEQQIQQLATIRTSMTQVLGSQKAVDDLLGSSIYIFHIGSNDLLEYVAAPVFDPAYLKQFVTNVTQAYAAHLTTLYELGARKFAIIGIPPLGCAPATRVLNATGGCADVMNESARLFHIAMQSLLTNLSMTLKGFKYSLGNMYTVTMDAIDNPRGNGFKEVKTACCGNGTTDCNVGVNLCSNRRDFLFWDKFHATEKASGLAALALVYAPNQQNEVLDSPNGAEIDEYNSLKLLRWPCIRNGVCWWCGAPPSFSKPSRSSKNSLKMVFQMLTGAPEGFWSDYGI